MTNSLLTILTKYINTFFITHPAYEKINIFFISHPAYENDTIYMRLYYETSQKETTQKDKQPTNNNNNNISSYSRFIINKTFLTSSYTH